MNLRPERLVFLAPFVFAAHVLEESNGFVEWFNSVVPQGLSEQEFVAINSLAMIITIGVTAWTALRQREAALFALGWFSFLMLANGILHITATVLEGKYVPGLATSLCLYMPYFGVYLRAVRRTHQTRTPILATIIILGSMPMFAQGYSVLFRGRTLLWP